MSYPLFRLNNFIDPFPNEDLTGYEGHVVYVSSAKYSVCSLTNQGTTNALKPAGIIVSGGDTSTAADVAIDGFVEAVAGTGGVTAGSAVVSEYAASGLDRGRLIDFADTAIDPADWVIGYAETAAAEDGKFILALRPFQVHNHAA